MSEVYHYSPDLLQLLVDTIDALHRSKRDVILFFRGAGVHGQVIDDLAEQVSRDRDSIYKHEIAQKLLVMVIEGGDATLHQRREIVTRVEDGSAFSTFMHDPRLTSLGVSAHVPYAKGQYLVFVR